MVEFSGWKLPLHYGSQLAEHHAVRRHAGVFDVSHMSRIDIAGPGAVAFLATMLITDVSSLMPGHAVYTCMLNPRGGVIDDFIVTRIDRERFRVVGNAANRTKDLQWFATMSGGSEVHIAPRDDLAMIAVQGPNARSLATKVLPPHLAKQSGTLHRFQMVEVGDWQVSRTGYTGEDGFEITFPVGEAVKFWRDLMQVGVIPCGLGARDTLRLEAGYPLYGAELDETHSPLASGLGRLISWVPVSRSFIGREALEQERARGDLPRFAGLCLEAEGIMRGGATVILADGRRGKITSGGFSPTLRRSIALARIPPGTDTDCQVEIRGRPVPAKIVKPRFVRYGRVLLETDSITGDEA
jgi:aminomethyltransferase